MRSARWRAPNAPARIHGHEGPGGLRGALSTASQAVSAFAGASPARTALLVFVVVVAFFTAVLSLPVMSRSGQVTALHDALVLLDGAARQVASDVRDQARALGRDRSSEAAGGLAVARTAVADLVDALDRMTSDSVRERRDVAWVERPRMGAEPPRLTLAPVDVAGSLADSLLEDRAEQTADELFRIPENLRRR